MNRAPQETRTYFLTAVAAGRRKLFQVDATARLMMETIQAYRAQGKFELYAFVIMPDHVHLLLTPAAEVSVEKVAQLVKGNFSFRMKGKSLIWEDSYFDKRAQDRDAFDTYVEYIHQNPVRAGLVKAPEDYPYSSAARQDLIDPAPEWFYPPSQG